MPDPNLLDQQSVWQKLMNANASPLQPIDANFSPEANQQIMMLNGAPGGGVTPQPSNLDQATMAQRTRGGPDLSLGNPLPMNPFLAGMSQSGERSSGRKDALEGRANAIIDAPSTESLDSQKDAVKAYADRVKAYADRPLKEGLAGLNLAPLAALADSMNPGSKLAAGYVAPETVQQHDQNVMAMQGKLADLQGGVTKEQNEMTKAQLAALVGMDKANKDNSFTTSFMARADETNHRTVLQDIKKDADLKALGQNQRMLGNAKSMLTDAAQQPPQQFDELQAVIRKNIGMTGVTGLSERDKTYFNDLGIDAKRAQQYFFGTPVSVGESGQEFIGHLNQLVDIQQQNLQRQANLIIAKHAAGNEAMYQRRPDLWAGVQSVAGAAAKQFDPNQLNPKSSPQASTSKPPSKYDSMSDADLQALYAQKMGKS